MDLSGLNPVKILKRLAQETFHNKLGDYAELEDIRPDLKQKSLTLSLLLKGEEELVKIELCEFSIKKSEQHYFFHIGMIQTSRMWLTLLGQDFLNGKFGNSGILIPSKYAPILKIIL